MDYAVRMRVGNLMWLGRTRNFAVARLDLARLASSRTRC